MLSSALGMMMILRSGQWSPYHRIMFLMFFWDMISSTAIALTTIPMPTDVHDTYEFAGRAFGSAATCTAQGFTIMVGQFFTVYTNCVLNVYFVCTLRYGMSTRTINSRLLPIMLTVACFISFPIFFMLLNLGLFNPQRYEPYCYIGVYPEDCNRLEYVECISKDIPPDTENKFMFLFTMLLGTSFLLVVVSMLLVTLSVTERMTKPTKAMIVPEHQDQNLDGGESEGAKKRSQDDQDEVGDNGHEDDESSKKSSSSSNSLPDSPKNFGLVAIVAIMYIVAFFLTWIWTVISIVPVDKSTISEETWLFIGYARILFSPLQGFFNVLIFIFNKALDFCLTSSRSRRISFWNAVCIVVCSPARIPEVVITRIDMVEQSRTARNDNDEDAVFRAAEQFFHADFEDDSHFASRQGPAHYNISGTGTNNKEHFDNDEEFDIDAPAARRCRNQTEPCMRRKGRRGGNKQLNNQESAQSSILSSGLLSRDESGQVSDSVNSLLSGFSSVPISHTDVVEKESNNSLL